MAHLQRARACLRISADDLDPAEISRLLGCEPTTAHAKGEQIKRRNFTREAKFGMWRLNTSDTEPENLDQQVLELTQKTTKNLDVWRDLSRRFEIDLFCGWFMGTANEGVEISPQTLTLLGERGITLALDIYGAEASN